MLGTRAAKYVFRWYVVGGTPCCSIFVVVASSTLLSARPLLLGYKTEDIGSGSIHTRLLYCCTVVPHTRQKASGSGIRLKYVPLGRLRVARRSANAVQRSYWHYTILTAYLSKCAALIVFLIVGEGDPFPPAKYLYRSFLQYPEFLVHPSFATLCPDYDTIWVPN